MFFDIAFRKDSQDHVYGFFFVGENAGEYTDLPNENAIFQKVMAQLDLIYEGKASRYYEKHYVQNWSKAPFTLYGRWGCNVGAFGAGEAFGVRKESGAI